MANGIITQNDVQDKVIVVRGQQVLLDRDVAVLYGVSTGRINEAVKNNVEKFPNGYLFPLTNEEKIELIENFDRFESMKHSPNPPTAFTEHGLYMLLSEVTFYRTSGERSGERNLLPVAKLEAI